MRSGEGKIQSVRDAALEHGEMIGQRQHGLHHVQIVHPRRIDLRQGRGEKIGLLLIVALDRHAVAGLDDRLEQLGRPLGAADLCRSYRGAAAARASREGAIGFAP